MPPDARQCPACGADAWTLPRPIPPFEVDPPPPGVEYVGEPHYGMPVTHTAGGMLAMLIAVTLAVVLVIAVAVILFNLRPAP